MKKLLFLIFIVGLLLTIGCSKQWYEHDTIYKTNDHLVYSLWGYDNCDEFQEYQTLQEEQGGWWGEERLDCSK